MREKQPKVLKKKAAAEKPAPPAPRSFCSLSCLMLLLMFQATSRRRYSSAGHPLPTETPCPAGGVFEERREGHSLHVHDPPRAAEDIDGALLPPALLLLLLVLLLLPTLLCCYRCCFSYFLFMLMAVMLRCSVDSFVAFLEEKGFRGLSVFSSGRSTPPPTRRTPGALVSFDVTGHVLSTTYTRDSAGG